MTLINKEFLFTIMAVYFFSYYRNPHEMNMFLLRTYQFVIDFFNCIQKYSEDSYNLLEDSNKENENNNKDSYTEELKPEVKYEDKYLEDIRKLNKEFQFDENEQKVAFNKFIEILSLLKKDYMKKTEDMKNQMNNNNAKLAKYEGQDDDYYVCEDSEDSEDSEDRKECRETKIQKLLEENTKLTQEISKTIAFLESDEGQIELVKKAHKSSKEFVIDQQLDKLKNCYVIEKTPLGNVLMFYNNKRSSFEFYSDNTIPYRYLESVGRKYVKVFNCRPIFVDMEEELRVCEELLEKEKRDKEIKEEELKKKAEQLKERNLVVEEKKNVFAKFKTYNKEAGTGRVNTGAPPKNSIPNKQISEKQSSEPILLKTNANRYTYEGKLSNFNFLKKIERKVVDKKYGMSFADFKKKMIEMK